MKKVFALAILATVPVACGTVPTAPDVPSLATPSADASFAASGRGGTIGPICSSRPADFAEVHGVTLNVVQTGRGFVTVRAELLVLGSQAPSPCFSPVFSVQPSGRGIVLGGSWDRQQVTLTAPAGAYLVTAASDVRGLSGSLRVQVPQIASN
jgi:hypothetical protein